MVTIGNSQFNGKYVFNGQLTDKPPYTLATAETAQVDQGEIKFEIGTGARIAANKPGNSVFGEPDDPTAPGTKDNIFRVLKDLVSALGTGNTNQVSAIIGRIDTQNDKFLEARSDVGAKSNRIELANVKVAGYQCESAIVTIEDGRCRYLRGNHQP